MEKFLGLPPLASQHGADVDRLILYMHFLMGALFVGWLSYFLYVLFRFRASKNPKASYVGVTSHASSYVEAMVVLVEAILLIGFAVPLWGKIAGKFPSEKESTVIRLTAEQFAWNARYPGADGVFGKQDVKLSSAQNPFGLVPDDPNGKDDVVPPLNEMAVPVGKPVIVYITSKDVIHSFKVNPLRVTQDAIPGMRIPLSFVPTVEGEYMINCAQLCGNSHYFMKGLFKVLSQQNFNTWMAEKSKGGGAAATFE